MNRVFKLSCLLICIFLSYSSFSQTIYSKSFGNSKDEPIVFIHGGPSGNSTLFEFTTAQKLAEKGFYVIVYDRRGEGRSIDSTATFTYNEAFDDLNEIFNTYKLDKANILGHSFGGLVATLFACKHPQKIKSLILAAALFAQQETYDHILKSTEKKYKVCNDTLKIEKIREIKMLDRNSAQYRKECYDLASENNFFKMPKPTKMADSLRYEYENSFSQNNIRNQNAPQLFYKNESLRNINIKSKLKQLNESIDIHAIYGKQDGIFSKSQMHEMKYIVGKRNFALIENCSHYLFVDQQQNFINNIVKWFNK